MDYFTEDLLDVDKDKILSLPIEDSTWFLGDIDDPVELEGFEDTDEPFLPGYIALTVVHPDGFILACNTKPKDQMSIRDQLICVLHSSMLRPLMGKPRRPRFLCFRKDHVLADISDLVRDYQMTLVFGDDLPTVDFPDLIKACAFCGRQGSPGLFEKCPSCNGMNYCGEVCRRRDMGSSSNPHGHRHWCEKVSDYVSKTQQLALLPFEFAKVTTQPDFDSRKLDSFLKQRGLYHHGYWRTLRDTRAHDFGAIPDEEDPYVLPEEGCILGGSERLVPIERPLVAWEEYYEWRGFKLDSPIAILLQFPLTVYYIITTLLPLHYPDRMMETAASLSALSSFTIHLLGVEQEVDLLPVFFELGQLIPKVKLRLEMYGPDIASQIDGKVTQHDNVTVRIHRKLYHQVKTGKPDLVIGLNAGLAAFPSWKESLQQLMTLRFPAYFTDYCQYSCEASRISVESLGLGTLSEPAINPFRSPIRTYSTAHDMPWYSNAFITHLVYTSTQETCKMS